MASGCLGLISFPREPGRLTIERIEALHPSLIEELRNHEGIGFLLVDSERDGALAIGADGVNRLERGEILGSDPLAPFGANAARHVLRTHGFPHCPDIVINSRIWNDPTEVAAFEELVGSHGGLGGSQSYPFVLAPAELALAGRGGRRRRVRPPDLPGLARRPRAGRLCGRRPDGAGSPASADQSSSEPPGSSSSALTPGDSSAT